MDSKKMREVSLYVRSDTEACVITLLTVACVCVCGVINH